MILSKKKNKFSLNKSDLFPFFEGLDIFINLSLITYLCSFFLPNVDLRISIIILLSIILLSIISELFSYKIFKVIHTRLKKPNFYICLIFAYLLIILLPAKLFFPIGIILFLLSRLIIGNTFAILKIVNDNNALINQFANLKYWVIFFLGVIFGSLLLMVTNEIFSNSQLNTWAWKVPYFFFLILLIIGFLFSKNKQINALDSVSYDNNDIKRNIKIADIFENLHVLIPVFTIILFSTSMWMPKFSNPENMQFLQYDFLYFFLSLIALFFISPLSKLIGNKNSIKFFYISSIIVSLICLFIEHNSSYSINFIKLFFSILSSFAICILILRQDEIKSLNIKQKSLILNFINLFFILLIPIIFYTFIHITINYSIVYLVIGFIMVISYIAYSYGKKR